MGMTIIKGINVATLTKIKVYNLYEESTDKIMCSPQEYLDYRILHSRLQTQERLSNNEEFMSDVLNIIYTSDTKDKEFIKKCRTIVDMNVELVDMEGT